MEMIRDVSRSCLAKTSVSAEDPGSATDMIVEMANAQSRSRSDSVISEFEAYFEFQQRKQRWLRIQHRLNQTSPYAWRVCFGPLWIMAPIAYSQWSSTKAECLNEAAFAAGAAARNKSMNLKVSCSTRESGRITSVPQKKATIHSNNM
jgi:hypothetical protein